MAAVTTWDEISQFFGPPAWQAERSDGRIISHNRLFNVDIEPISAVYEYSIEATDDPTDSESRKTTDPVKDIAKFLGRGIPGGEFFEKMSFELYRLSASIDQIVELIKYGADVNTLRRASIMPGVPDGLSAIRMASRFFLATKEAEEAIDTIEKRMEEKGWDIKRTENDIGAPMLKVNISDIYSAEIELDSVEYEYIFQMKHNLDLSESGKTEDPIRAFRTFIRSEEMDDAIADFREQEEATAETSPAPDSLKETIPVNRPKESDIREKETVPPNKETVRSPK